MLGGGAFEFRRGLGFALLGIAFLLGAIFFSESAVATPPYGAGNSVIRLALAIAGGILSLVGAAMIVGRPASPPRYPPRM